MSTSLPVIWKLKKEKDGCFEAERSREARVAKLALLLLLLMHVALVAAASQPQKITSVEG